MLEADFHHAYFVACVFFLNHLFRPDPSNKPICIYLHWLRVRLSWHDAGVFNGAQAVVELLCFSYPLLTTFSVQSSWLCFVSRLTPLCHTCVFRIAGVDGCPNAAMRLAGGRSCVPLDMCLPFLIWLFSFDFETFIMIIFESFSDLVSCS